jgi:ATP-dependent Zn protease
LLDLELEWSHGRHHVFALDDGDETRWLNGNAEPIHATNSEESLELTEATVRDYLRFFLFFLRAEQGAFVVLEAGVQVLADELDPSAAAQAQPILAEVESVIHNLKPLAPREHGDGRWAMDCFVAYDDAIYRSAFAVRPDGDVEMLDDEPVVSLDGLSVMEYPSLIPELVRDRDITEAIVAVLLEDAFKESELEAHTSHTLIGHFNSQTAGDTPLALLTRLVAGSMPVLIIESDIPFVEDFVAGVVDGPGRVISHGAIGRGRPHEYDERRCVVDYAEPSTRVHLISFHAYSTLYDEERTAHELAIHDAAVFIGCHNVADVPEPLRRISDQKLTFPRIDRSRFVRIFERVFGVKPAPGWDTGGADWTRYLVPADFHAPRRAKLGPDEALSHLQLRIENRLRDLTPTGGLRLNELHGMSEARQICEDMVADIRAAEAGEIPWKVVDKGVLLVGAPGTGKTTLARALATECDVKFIVASAAGWQAAGALDSHLRAIRGDFAEARRYAPSILFIDEIDSIGSRERLAADRNILYQTEVINALLEQIQGIDTADDHVIVVGATNYAENVDPALRRAGRLDQVVELPLPNIPALEKIFEGYLRPHKEAKNVARGLDIRTLAELSWGCTGADVELFVRGASRRARRARRKIKQDDLLAEVTGRPRRPDSVPRQTIEALRRTAVHEAGHAVARLVSSTQGEDISFVTIVPRLDGTLGFVATVPLEGHALTRRTMLERLETILAGRAAEEIVYGADDVGAGAGGPSESSDLAVATRWAELIVCQSGLGDDGALYWTRQPTSDQQKQIGALLASCYSGVVAQLEANRELLDRVAEVLVEKQELSGTELRKIWIDDPGRTSARALH